MVAHELKPQERTKSLDSKAKGTMCAEPVISNGPPRHYPQCRGPTLAVILLLRLHDRAWILTKDAKHFSISKLLPFAALSERQLPFVSYPPC